MRAGDSRKSSDILQAADVIETLFKAGEGSARQSREDGGDARVQEARDSRSIARRVTPAKAATSGTVGVDVNKTWREKT